MQILQTFAGLFANLGNLTWQMVVMWVIGGQIGRASCRERV